MFQFSYPLAPAVGTVAAGFMTDGIAGPRGAFHNRPSSDHAPNPLTKVGAVSF